MNYDRRIAEHYKKRYNRQKKDETLGKGFIITTLLLLLILWII